MVKIIFINFILIFLYIGKESLINSQKCYDKFSQIISKLPLNCQTKVFSVFRNETEEECCEIEDIISRLKECFQIQINEFSINKTISSRVEKKGLGSIKANQFIDSIILNNQTNPNDKLMYDSEIKTNLQLINENNKLTTNCINILLKVNTYLLTRMCLNPNSLDKYFKRNGNIYTDVIVPSNLNHEIYNECSLLALKTNELNNNFLNIFIKNLNYLIGIGSCNYYSDTFSFKLENDINDSFFPYNTIYNQSIHTESYETLLNKWLINMLAETYIDMKKLIFLNSKMKETEYKFPLGLSTSLGRKEINYGIIINTFYVQKYKSFYVQCEDLICTAYCDGCQNIVWDKEKVITDNNYILYVSCAKNICLVYIENKDTKISGGEIFYLRGNSKILEVDNLLIEKLENFKKSLDKELTKNKKMFNNLIEEIKINKEKYVIDFNLGLAFYQEIQVNSTHNISLIDYLYNYLYKGNEPFSFKCDNISCEYNSYERKINYNLNINKEEIISTDWRRFLRGSSGGRSGGGSSHSSISGIHSSTKSGGSSITHISSSSSTHSSTSSSKSGGSSLTGSTKFSGFSSSKNSGSTLTKSSSQPSLSSLHINKGSSLSHTTYNSGTSWKPTRTWYTSTSSTSSTHNTYYYGHSSYPISSNSKVYTTYHSSNFYHPTTSNTYYYYNYRPTYYIHYDYFPHWNHYNYHYIDNNYYYHYRAHSVNDYHNNETITNDDDSNLNPVYDPNDWVLSYEGPSNIEKYKGEVLHIFVECSPYFCLNYVKANNGDNFFIDVLTRNLIFIDENGLNQRQKYKFFKELFMRNNDTEDRIRFLNSAKTAELDIPYKSFPVKYSCFQELYFFSHLFNYSESLSSRDLSDDHQDFYINCLNGTLSKEKKSRCGLNIYNSLSSDTFFPLSSNFNSRLLRKPDLKLNLTEDNFDINSYNMIMTSISFDINIDGSNSQAWKEVKESDIKEYEKLTNEIIDFGIMDNNAFSFSNILEFKFLSLCFIIYCLIIT